MIKHGYFRWLLPRKGGGFALGVLLFGLHWLSNPAHAAVLNKFDIKTQGEGVTITLHADERIQYETDTNRGAFFVILKNTQLSAEQVQHGLPIVMDNQNRFIGRAIPMGDDQVKIVLPNLPANEYAVSVSQKTGRQKHTLSQTIAEKGKNATSSEASTPIEKKRRSSPLPKVVTAIKDGSGSLANLAPVQTPKATTVQITPSIINRDLSSNAKQVMGVSPLLKAQPRPAVLQPVPQSLSQFESLAQRLQPKVSRPRLSTRYSNETVRNTPTSKPWSSWSPNTRPKKRIKKRKSVENIALSPSSETVPEPVSSRLALSPAPTAGKVKEKVISSFTVLDPSDGSTSSTVESDGFNTVALAGEGESQSQVESVADVAAQSGLFGLFKSLPLWAIIIGAICLGALGFLALILGVYLLSGIVAHRIQQNHHEQQSVDTERELSNGISSDFNEQERPSSGLKTSNTKPRRRSKNRGFSLKHSSPTTRSVQKPHGTAPVSPHSASSMFEDIPSVDSSRYLIQPSRSVREALRKGTQLQFSSQSKHQTISSPRIRQSSR